MVFMDEEKLNKEMEDLRKYIDSRKLILGEIEFLVGNFIPYLNYQIQKAAQEKMKKEMPGKSIAKPTGENPGS